MHDPGMLVLFFTAAALLVITPGPAVLYIVARSIDQGRTAGLVSVAGIATGTLFHIAAAALGISAILVRSALAFNVVKYAGAAYLVFLGIQRLRHAGQKLETAAVEPEPLSRIFRNGVAVNLLNPKTALFFFAFLPQFVSADRGNVAAQIVTLGLLFLVMASASDAMYAVLAGSAANWLRGQSRFVRVRDYVTATVYIGLGLATAATSAPGRK